MQAETHNGGQDRRDDDRRHRVLCAARRGLLVPVYLNPDQPQMRAITLGLVAAGLLEAHRRGVLVSLELTSAGWAAWRQRIYLR